MYLRTIISVLLCGLLVVSPVYGGDTELIATQTSPRGSLETEEAPLRLSPGFLQLAVLGVSNSRESFESPGASSGSLESGNEGESASGVSQGVQLMVAGAALALVGILYKFGTEKISFDPDGGISGGGKSYSAANYALMVVGGGGFFGGLVIETSRSPASEGYDGLDSRDSELSYIVGPSIGVRVAF